MAIKRSFKTRRRIVKSKKSILPKILVVGAIGGGAYLIWKNILKPYLDSQQDKNSGADVSGATDQAIQTVVNTAANTTPNVTSLKLPFNPVGTPWEQLNFTTPITYGSKGEEVKRLQRIINDLYDVYVRANMTPQFKKIAVTDGVFGAKTWESVKPFQYKAQNLAYWRDYYWAQKKKFDPTYEEGEEDPISWITQAAQNQSTQTPNAWEQAASYFNIFN